MNRRELLASAAALALPIPVATAVEEKKAPPRQFRKFIRPLEKWVEIKPEDAVAGDVVWICDPPFEDQPEYREVILVTRNDPASGEMYSAFHIDPKTNKWIEWV